MLTSGSQFLKVNTIVFRSILVSLSFSFTKSPKKISNTKYKDLPRTFVTDLVLSDLIKCK